MGVIWRRPNEGRSHPHAHTNIIASDLWLALEG